MDNILSFQRPPVLELRREVDRLRHELQQLRAQAARNESLWLRVQAHEVDLLTAETLPQLLYRLSEGTVQAFALDHVAVCLWDPEAELRRLLAHAGQTPDLFPALHFLEDRGVLVDLCAESLQPRAIPWSAGRHPEVVPGEAGVHSVLLLPLVRLETLFGCLILGSRALDRFTPAHGTDFLGRLGTVAALCLENMANRERIALSGLIDALTGVPNRRFLQRRLEEELARAQRYRQPLACLFIDVDHFKRVNDAHGHALGDGVLAEVASRIRDQLRVNDVVARYGGEEFVVLLPHTDISEAVALAERIRVHVARGSVLAEDGRSVSVTVSAGVAAMRPEGRGGVPPARAEELLARADGALYAAKNGGRDRVVVDRS